MKIPQLIHLLKTYDITPDKSKGQHFLIDETVVGDMLEVAGVGETDTVLEIGPGVGVLTAGLVQKAGQVYAYELDDQLAELISSQNESNLTVIRGDVLQSPLPPTGVTDYKVVANIPYNITGLILRQLVEANPKARSLTLLVQKEVAERVSAKPGQMSIIAVAVQLHGVPSMVREVSPKAFWPAPRVDSAVLHIELRPELTVDVEEALFMRLVKFGFAQKRKQLKNTLSVGLKITSAEVEEALLASDLKATARAQELSLEEWSKLYRLLLSKLT